VSWSTSPDRWHETNPRATTGAVISGDLRAIWGRRRFTVALRHLGEPFGKQAKIVREQAAHAGVQVHTVQAVEVADSVLQEFAWQENTNHVRGRFDRLHRLREVEHLYVARPPSIEMPFA
jgi:hypothetical protein